MISKVRVRSDLHDRLHNDHGATREARPSEIRLTRTARNAVLLRDQNGELTFAKRAAELERVAFN